MIDDHWSILFWFTNSYSPAKILDLLWLTSHYLNTTISTIVKWNPILWYLLSPHRKLIPNDLQHPILVSLLEKYTHAASGLFQVYNDIVYGQTHSPYIPTRKSSDIKDLAQQWQNVCYPREEKRHSAFSFPLFFCPVFQYRLFSGHSVTCGTLLSIRDSLFCLVGLPSLWTFLMLKYLDFYRASSRICTVEHEIDLSGHHARGRIDCVLQD